MSVIRLIALGLLVAGLVAGLLPLRRASAQITAAKAKEVGCKTLVASVKATGEVPRVIVNSDKGMVRVEATIGYCFEPIAQWSARKWEKITPLEVEQSQIPKDKERRQEATRAPALAPETIAPRPQFPPPTAIQPALPRPSGPCDARLKDYWKVGWHNIGGIPHWLDSVHTIDLDGDTWTDNVGFRFKTENAPDVVMRYFAAPGRKSAKSLPDLKLPAEAVIPRFCFGQLNLGRPLTNVFKKKPFELPDLQKEAREMAEARARAAKNPDNGVALWTLVAAAAGVLLAGGGGLAIYLVRRRKAAVLDHLVHMGGGKEADEAVAEEAS